MNERLPGAANGPEWQEVTTVEEMQAFYLSRLPAIREAARSCGYAIGLHGSTRRDLDLIAVPWVEAHSFRDDLAKTVHKAACGFTSASYVWQEKPHGRVATSMPICWPTWYDVIGAGHIDLSVIESSITNQFKSRIEPATPTKLHWP